MDKMPNSLPFCHASDESLEANGVGESGRPTARDGGALYTHTTTQRLTRFLTTLSSPFALQQPIYKINPHILVYK